MKDFMTSLQEINTISIIARLTLAIVFGGVIGYERGRKRRPAGLRTHILVCIGSALVMITSQYMMEIRHYSTDPSRLGAQVISGIGFLGAGTILITVKQQVKGLTTAAGLWASACMGLALGIGFYEGAIIACVFIYTCNTVLHRFDVYTMSRTKLVEVYVQVATVSAISNVFDMIRRNNMTISDVEISKTRNPEDTVGLFITIKQQEKHDHEKILLLLSGIEDVLTVDEI